MRKFLRRRGGVARLGDEGYGVYQETDVCVVFLLQFIVFACAKYCRSINCEVM